MELPRPAATAIEAHQRLFRFLGCGVPTPAGSADRKVWKVTLEQGLRAGRTCQSRSRRIAAGKVTIALYRLGLESDYT
jgi:hypothetical protein